MTVISTASLTECPVRRSKVEEGGIEATTDWNIAGGQKVGSNV
jgi:hypothetical protein